MNVVRKHVSTIKGGRLATAAAPARVVSLIVSDIPGDDPALVASGPTVPDAGTPAMARAVVATYGLDLPPAVLAHLASRRAAPRPTRPTRPSPGTRSTSSPRPRSRSRRRRPPPAPPASTR